MTLLLSSKSDEPKHPQAREIKCNYGQILGQLDEMIPFLSIAEYGASLRDMWRGRMTEATAGMFVIGTSFMSRVGLILPLSLCRDEKARTALLEISTLIDGTRKTTMSDRRRMVQARLDEAFGSDLRIADKESLDGFFALTPSTGLFQRLSESFDYVTEILDNAAGMARVTGTSRFRWRSYGELMEWHHGLRNSDRFCLWLPLMPFFVCGNTDVLYHSYCHERWARDGLSRPVEEPSKWFMLRPGLPDAKLDIRLEMEEYGWAILHLTLDNVSIKIYLSQEHDPFLELASWGREIDEGDLPIEMEIDEEGSVAVLTVLRTENPERVLLRIKLKYKNEILLEGITARATLAATLKAELIRFFTTEFDPQHWDSRYNHDQDDNPEDDDPESDRTQTRDLVLNHPWLASGP